MGERFYFKSTFMRRVCRWDNKNKKGGGFCGMLETYESGTLDYFWHGG